MGPDAPGHGIGRIGEEMGSVGDNLPLSSTAVIGFATADHSRRTVAENGVGHQAIRIGPVGQVEAA